MSSVQGTVQFVRMQGLDILTIPEINIFRNGVLWRPVAESFHQKDFDEVIVYWCGKILGRGRELIVNQFCDYYSSACQEKSMIENRGSGYTKIYVDLESLPKNMHYHTVDISVGSYSFKNCRINSVCYRYEIGALDLTFSV